MSLLDQHTLKGHSGQADVGLQKAQTQNQIRTETYACGGNSSTG
jgi:hypothetical protein